MLLKGLFIAVGVILALSILLKIPGVELIIRPIFSLLQKLVEYVLGSLGAWCIWLLQTILRAHKDLFTHLAHDEEHFDIKLKVERRNRQS